MTWHPSFPITALSKDAKIVRAEADKSPMRITENGRGAYVFMSEKVFRSLVDGERADAAYEAYLLDSMGQGVADVEADRVVTSRPEMFAEAARRRVAGEADHA